MKPSVNKDAEEADRGSGCGKMLSDKELSENSPMASVRLSAGGGADSACQGLAGFLEDLPRRKPRNKNMIDLILDCVYMCGCTLSTPSRPLCVFRKKLRRPKAPLENALTTPKACIKTELGRHLRILLQAEFRCVNLRIQVAYSSMSGCSIVSSASTTSSVSITISPAPPSSHSWMIFFQPKFSAESRTNSTVGK